MNDTNPFIPQGSLLEQKNKKRARVKIAVLAIFGLNLLLISPLLLVQACHRGDTAQNDSDTNTATADTGTAMTASNLTAAMATSNLAVTTSNLQPPAVVQTPPTTPAPTVAADATEYVILPHDTYSSIAKKFPGLSYKAIEAANPDVPPTKLMPGKKIKIPPTTGPMAVTGGATDGDNIYVVKSGDYLINIARKYGTTVKALQDLNDLKTTSIKAGQKLKVPVKVAQSTGITPDAAPATTTASNPLQMQPPAPTLR